MPTRTAHAPPDRDALFDALCRADILTVPQLRKAAMAVTEPAVTDGPGAAAALVAAGLLTRFQADRLLAGRTDGFVLGPHVILEPVGRGAASRVYKARHRTMNRLVAVKVLSAERAGAVARRQFRDAARAAGRLSHPHIVTALDANEVGGRFYLVLEFVDGPSAEALVRGAGPLPVGEACEVMRQAAHALAHAHDLGTAHGALAPGKVLVGRAASDGPPAVKVAGFGLPPSAGAAEYAAPEVQGGTAASARADLYSLGGVFHFLLTGRPPCGAPARLDQLRPDVRPELAAVVSRLLAPRPEDRFASAGELLVHLDAACVPVAASAGWVSFELPAASFPVDSGGYLTGRVEFDAGPSPWEQITTATAADTARVDPDDRTPAPRGAPRLPPPAAPAPRWAWRLLLGSAALLAFVIAGAAVKLLAR